MSEDMLAMLDQAERDDTMIITTVEAFHKEPGLLYEFLNRAANMGIVVHMASIKTTDKSYVK